MNLVQGIRGRQRAPCHHGNTYALLDFEDILVRGAVWSYLLFVGIAVEIENTPPVEGVKEVLAHPFEGWVVEPGVVRDEGENSRTTASDLPFCESKKLHVVVL